MKKIILIFCLIFSFLICSQVLAEDAAAKILEFKEKILELQNQGELGIKNLAACSKVNAFGSYVPLEGRKIKKGERLFVYLEPLNFFTKKTNGKYEIFLAEDIIILNEKGDIIAGKENAIVYNYASQSPVIDIFFTNVIDLKDIPPGRYTFRAILNDKLKNKTDFKSLFFEIID